ncbi:flavin prenyltransferase UbiX [Streptomyces paromomycinus]|uniref:Probable UbiX-like flavin prenyltransferase n=2 Tax=Streptomyces paromomycinus TaxID=92743 RepID=A0A401VVG0_STREY|nr:flavin prenyltransferase UbiX [Streptomyces paromomycinus]
MADMADTADSAGTLGGGSAAPARLVVGITGATGAVLGVRLLERLRAHGGVETHLVISRWARSTIEWETAMSVREVGALADVVHSPEDQGAAISSGSFRVDGMVIAPCSMKSLAAIRMGYADGLIARAADVTLKERRKLVLVPREAPLSEIHLDNMLTLARMGAVMLPPVPAFYQHPATVEDIVDHTVTRVLDQFGIDTPKAYRWNGMYAARRQARDAEEHRAAAVPAPGLT